MLLKRAPPRRAAGSLERKLKSPLQANSFRNGLAFYTAHLVITSNEIITKHGHQPFAIASQDSIQ